MTKQNAVQLGSISPGAVQASAVAFDSATSALTMLNSAKTGKKRAKPAKRRPVKAKAAKPAVIEPKQAESMVDVFIYPNKGKGEVDSVKVTVNEKKQSFTALSKAKLDISSLDVSGLVKSFFIGLNSPKLSGVQFVYKNAYQIAFGLGEVRPSSYKCVIANHFTDGLATLVFNQGKWASLDSIKAALEKASVSFIPKATYAYVTLSKDNLAKVTRVARSLLKLGKQG